MAKDERLTRATTSSLVIVVCGLIPMLMISHAIMLSCPRAPPTAAPETVI